MEYSIDDMTKLSKVSIRTLHYYDEIGLLKPSVRMENGRRFYCDEQVIRLMDILFFKKMGFSLKKIESMLNLGNKDKRALMLAKKKFLQKEITRFKEIIHSIDSTLEFMFKGENMNYKQILKQFENFQHSAKEDKQTFINEFGSLKNTETEKLKNMKIKDQIEYCKNLFKNVDMQEYGKKIASCMKKLIEAIDNNFEEDSKEVQELMGEYFDIISMTHIITKKQWLGMAVTIGEDKECYSMYAKMHPKLPKFLSKAIKIYGENLKE